MKRRDYDCGSTKRLKKKKREEEGQRYAASLSSWLNTNISTSSSETPSYRNNSDVNNEDVENNENSISQKPCLRQDEEEGEEPCTEQENIILPCNKNESKEHSNNNQVSNNYF